MKVRPVRMAKTSLPGRSRSLTHHSSGGGGRTLSLQAARAVVCAVIGEALDSHDVAGLGRVDETPATDIDAHVAEAVEEDEVARPEVLARGRLPDSPEHPTRVRELDPDSAVDIHHEARAVEARGGRAGP